MRYNIVLMDADDTLFDFKKSERVALEQVLINNDILINDDIINCYSKINLELWKMLEKGEIEREVLKVERFSRFLQKIDKSGDGASFNTQYMVELGKCGYIIDGADSLCKRLYGKCRLFIATNGLIEVQKNRLRCSGLDRYIEKMFISEEMDYQKPDKRYFDYIFNYLGENADRSKIIMLGDTITSDIQGGINAGIDTCLFDPDDKYKDYAKCTYKIKSLDEFDNIVGV